MRALVRGVYATDVDIQAYRPANPADDGVWLRLLVGPADGPGEESLDILVCTPLWLRAVVVRAGPQLGLHHLIVEPLDLGVAIEFLRHRIESLVADDWPALSDQLTRIGYWEFQDYRP